jgi:LAS superfamily LD-carboxypeptidase LdcB
MKKVIASNAAITGCSDDHIVKVNDTQALLHPEVTKPWQVLKEAAASQGFELSIASGFRSSERQKIIWNEKLSGLRDVVDECGQVLDITQYESMEKIVRVLRWSALPGASRHHWGTDMDIYDKAAVDDNYSLRLVSDEYLGDGPFAPMINWLQEFLNKKNSPGFFFPYKRDNGGVMPEPWHLSYQPVADVFQRQWSLENFVAYIKQSDILEKETVLSNMDTLYERFVKETIFPDIE